MSIPTSSTKSAQAIVVNTVGYITAAEQGRAILPVGFMGKYRKKVRSKPSIGTVIEAGGSPETGPLTFAIFGRSLSNSPHSIIGVRTGLRSILATCEQRGIKNLVLHLDDDRFVSRCNEIIEDYPSIMLILRTADETFVASANELTTCD